MKDPVFHRTRDAAPLRRGRGPARPAGPSHGALRALAWLRHRESASARELGDAMTWPTAVAARVLRALAAHGLVEFDGTTARAKGES